MQIGKQFVVSTRVDQYLNNQRTELFWDLLANPADKDASHTQNLQDLANDYPQSGLLQALLTYIGDDINLQHAAVYYSPQALYKLNKNIDGLRIVRADQLLSQKSSHLITGYFHVGNIETVDTAAVAGVPPALVTDAGYEASQHLAIDELQLDVNAPASLVDEGTTSATVISVAEPRKTDISEPQEAQNIVTAESEIESDSAVLKEPAALIEEDTFDEIVSIDDINLAVQEYYSKVIEPQTGTHEPTQLSDVFAEALRTEYEPTPIIEVGSLQPDDAPAIPASLTPEPAGEVNAKNLFNNRKVDLSDEAEKLILNNIASTDFFVFDRAFGERKDGETKLSESQPLPAEVPEPIVVSSFETAAPVAAIKNQPGSIETNNAGKADPYESVSKYHDEKMPYSFMWWLDKTRKEHSGIYQPFVEYKLDTTGHTHFSDPGNAEQANELQQQYIESIFQQNTVEELEGVGQPPVQFDPKKRVDEIIERFIQEVPQIKPQSADKIDNENKAKKSSEDMNELVTETLAQIYIDQMLYPKAIDTYKKLMLKFPEKSSYFAGQIETLQRK